MPRVQATNRILTHNIPYSCYFNGARKIALTTMGNMGQNLINAFSFFVYVRTDSRLTTAQYIIGELNLVGGTFLLSGIARAASKIGMWNVQLRDHTGRVLSVEVSSKQINDGAWHLLVYTKDATNTPAGVKMYIDRVDTAFDTTGNTGFADPANFTRNLGIGALHGSAGASNFFPGFITMPYFYDRVITQTEIDDLGIKGIIPTSPYAGYPMLEGADVTTFDVNNVYNGTLDNAAMWNLDSPRKSRVAASGRI